MTAQFTILSVCIGNIWRSPLCSANLQAQLGSHARCTSAGANAPVGTGADPLYIKHAANAGLDLSSHQAQRLTAALVNEADLILVMTRALRSYVVESVPPALRKTFTLKEFVLLTELHPAETWQINSLAEYLRTLQSSRIHVASADIDIPDPEGASVRVAKQVFQEILRDTASVATALKPAAQAAA